MSDRQLKDNIIATGNLRSGHCKNNNGNRVSGFMS